MRLILTLLLILLLSVAPGGRANPYSPPGFYEVEQVQLANGFRVVLQQREGALSVALRLVVGLGTRDLPCDQSEIPHLLEHVVFEGTAAYPEPGAWERQIKQWGGHSNAETDLDRTIYQVNIYGPHATNAVAALYQLARKALLDDASLASARRTVHRELGSDASALRRELYAHGIGQSGTAKIREALGIDCPGMERVDSTTRAVLIDLYQRYYVAGNMTLVVVGQFDKTALLEQIVATFGALPGFRPPPRPAWIMKAPTAPIKLHSTLEPVLGSEATVQIAFPTAGYLSEDFPILVVISRYLDQVLYDRLRRQAGWSYTPTTGWAMHPQTGYFYISTDVAPANREEVAAALREEIARLAREGLSPETVEELQRGLLLSYAQGNETNAQMANYFVDFLAELDVHGRFLNFEGRIEAVTAPQIQAVAARVLRPENSILALNAPTLTYGTALLLAGIGLLGMGVTLWGVKRKNRAAVGRFLMRDDMRPFGPAHPPITRET